MRYILGFIGVVVALLTALVAVASFEGGLSGDEISIIVFFGILTFLTLGYSITLGKIPKYKEKAEKYKKEAEKYKKEAGKIGYIRNAKAELSQNK